MEDEELEDTQQQTLRDHRRKSEGDAIRLLAPEKMEMKRKMKADYTEYDIV